MTFIVPTRDAQRTAAQTTTLPNRRAMHLQSAETWDAMAIAISDTTARALVNEAAKAELTAGAGR